MSDDSKNSDPFDFDFDALNGENPPEKAADSFDLDNPFGNDIVVQRKEVGADSPYSDDLPADIAADGTLAEESEQTDEAAPAETDKKKKKGFWGSKEKTKTKPQKEKVVKEKKEKVTKEKRSLKELLPRDMGSALCAAFSIFLLVSLLIFNITAFLTSGKSIMQTLCFLGTFNLIGLAAAAVPILFYKFPQERTLPNIMLGIAAVAIFTTVMVAVTEFYTYDFIINP